MSIIRVLLVEDHHIVRAGIRSLMQSIPGVHVVAESSDGRQALALVAEHRPNVVLMDIMMPGLNGLDATARISRAFPHVRVLILSIYSNEEYVLQAMQSGATGYLLKNNTPAELEMAIKSVARGETYLSPEVSKHVIASYVKRTSREISSLTRLTIRQREVLQLIAEGKSTKEIARLLDISVKTVEMHRSQLMETLDIHDIAGLVRYAIRVKLIEPLE